MGQSKEQRLARKKAKKFNKRRAKIKRLAEALHKRRLEQAA